MKKFNFLENLLRKKFAMSGMRGMNGLRTETLNPDSQPTVNQQSRLTSEQRHDSVTSARVAREWLNGSSRLRVDYDSFTCRLRVLPLKLVTVFAILLTIGVGNAWGVDSQLYFEGWESHNNGGSTPSYGSHTYGDFEFTYADAVSSGSPLTGSYHAILRNAKNTNQTCLLVSGALLSSSYEIHTISWNCKGKTNQTLKVYYSTDGSSWTQGYSAALTTSKEAKSITSLKITGPIYLKFQTTGNNTNNSHWDANIDDITILGEEIVSCTKIGAPTVTATPGDMTITLTWANQTGASSYTVTKTPAGGTVGTPSKSSSTWTCAITGLTNGTAYTWSVEPVGSGDYCASGNTAASASATPNVFRTITYYDKDGQHTTSLADGTNIATALTALYGGDDPVSCDATNYEYFVGWKVGEISGTASSVTLLDDEVVNSTTAADTYYAVWSDTDPEAASGWTQVTSVAVGDKVVIAQIDDGTTEMTGYNTTITTANNYGTYDSFSTDPEGTMVWTVEAGNSDDSFSFKNGSYYLRAPSTNNNYLYGESEKSNYSSWTIATSSSRAQVTNVGANTRVLMWNKSSTRFSTYTGKTHGNNSGSYYYYVIFYKQNSSGTPEYITTCCTSLGSINGSVSWSSGPNAKLIWDKDDHASEYVVKWKTHAGGEATYSTANVTTIKDTLTNKKTCTVTSLTAGSEYDFKIFITGKTTPSAYCDKDTVMTSTAIPVTVLKQDETGATISDAGVTATASGRTLTASAGSTNYLFKGWKYDTGADAGTTIDDNTSENTTLNGTPTGDVTVIAEFYKPRVIEWKVNNVAYTPGSPGSATVKYNSEWSELTLPTDPDVGDYCGQTFAGWTTTDLEEDALDKNVPADATRIAELNLMTSANKSGKTTVIENETTTFHAVFADYTTD